MMMQARGQTYETLSIAFAAPRAISNQCSGVRPASLPWPRNASQLIVNTRIFSFKMKLNMAKLNQTKGALNILPINSALI